MGVEPTEDTECPPTGLKPAKPTGTSLPPLIYSYIIVWIRVKYQCLRKIRDQSLR
jgi:hypothetical protein